MMMMLMVIMLVIMMMVILMMIMMMMMMLTRTTTRPPPHPPLLQAHFCTLSLLPPVGAAFLCQQLLALDSPGAVLPELARRTSARGRWSPPPGVRARLASFDRL